MWIGHQAISMSSTGQNNGYKESDWSFGVLVGVSGAKYWRLLLDSISLNILLS